MIQTEALSKTFGQTKAVQEVNLAVTRQDIMGLVGPDGAGKTTLIRMLCGLIKPSAGTVRLLGTAPNLINRNQLGYMPQRFSLYPDLTIRENVDFFGSMYGIDKNIIRERADQILSITNLLPFEHRLADRLSGGMKQKLALTCALITRPEILILDEPTYGVDPESRQEFWKILYQLNQQGLTILVSTPYMDEAELCKTVAFMNEGLLIAQKTPQQMKNDFDYTVLEVRTPVRDPYFFNSVPQVLDSSFYGYKYRLVVNNRDEGRQAVSNWLTNNHIRSFSLDIVTPSMEDVFIGLVKIYK